MNPPLILASASPRRRDLLQNLGLTFDIVPADIDETPLKDESPDALVSRLSTSKAIAIAAAYSDALIIAADTVVTLDGDILGKPRDAGESRRFTKHLSGRTHRVYTGHAAQRGEEIAACVVSTEVRFRNLSEHEIDWYVSTNEGMDKAGGYAIQGYGAALVSEIHGCYFNVVGLSVANLLELVSSLGVALIGREDEYPTEF